MRKRVTTKKFNRSVGHQKALKRNLLQSLIKHDRIVTTLPKAKYIRSFAEKLITRARVDTQTNRNYVNRIIFDSAVVERLFTEVAPRFTERPGGYTRIVKLGPRQGDATEMAVLEFVEKAMPKKTTEDTKTKSSSKKDDSKD